MNKSKIWLLIQLKDPQEDWKWESPLLGVYVDGVKKHFVETYEHIQKIMDLGTKNRTIAATQMNATSSRAHTIISVEFKQRKTAGTTKTEKISVINLVDLAGS